MTPIYASARSRAISVRWPAYLLKLLLASWGIALAAHFRVVLPWSPVPITGQTLAVAIVGLSFGPAMAFQAVCAYLLQGAASLPVFAGSSAGIAALTGATAGYLAAMPFAASAASALSRRGAKSYPIAVLAAWLSSAIVLLAGTLWLSHFVHGFRAALWAGLYPFLPGEAIKGVVAAGSVAGIRRLRRR
ncbi:MAG TPA: biotin transporter BioY [Armatimonadota bacterium]|jgi:biotin transport system substrate-specific component